MATTWPPAARPGEQGGPARPRRWLSSPPAADAWLAIAIAVAGVGGALGARHSHEYVPGAAVAVLAAMGLVLAARRHFPGAVLAAEAVFVVSLTGLGTTVEAGFFAVLIASYSAAVYAGKRLAACLAAAALATLAGIPLALAVWGARASGMHPPVTTILAAAGALIVGWLIRRQFALRSAQLDLQVERAKLAGEHHCAQVQQARLAERLRIARELHDIVAHHISVAVIQAQGAQSVADRDLPRAMTAIAEVERAGRTALVEMRRLVGLLRSGEPADDGLAAAAHAGAPDTADHERLPPPGLGDIGSLAERMRLVGLDVTVTTSGRPREVPGAAGLAGYRIVQEALTNALKHAGSARVTVGLDFGDVLEVVVSDDGRGAAAALGAAAVPGAGRGLAGMAERAAAVGGTFAAGPRPGGGFRVQATIPLAQR